MVVDCRHHCLHVFTLYGHYIGTMTLHKGTSSRLKLKNPYTVTTDSNGYTLIADTGNQYIYIFDTIGNYIATYVALDLIKLCVHVQQLLVLMITFMSVTLKIRAYKYFLHVAI